MLQYRKRYELLQLAHDNPSVKALQLQYRKRYELLQPLPTNLLRGVYTIVTIPQAVWAVATYLEHCLWCKTTVTIPQAVWAVATAQSLKREVKQLCYNTASGMSCCNFRRMLKKFSIVKGLQYRKRYELLQLEYLPVYKKRLEGGYNTASGMSCCNRKNQSRYLNT